MRKTMRPNAEDDASYCGRRYVLLWKTIRPITETPTSRRSIYRRKRGFLLPQKKIFSQNRLHTTAPSSPFPHKQKRKVSR